MSDEPTASGQSAPAATEEVEKKVEETSTAAEASEEPAPTVDNAKPSESGAPAEDKEAQKEDTKKTDSDTKDAESSGKTDEPSKDEDADVEMKDTTDAPETKETSKLVAAAADAEAAPAADADAADKSKSRRRSSGIPEHKGKKLSKKASKAKFFHTNAQPGDHFLVKLKGYPQWPVIVCDEEMLPETLIKSRPVTAQRADGTYREDYADGGKRQNDRTFPVMYLRTNEFGWVPNSALQELSADRATELLTDKVKKTPARTDSAKKPKIKLNTSSTPKTTNGATPKSGKESATKPAKFKSSKKDGTEKKAEKEKEVLFLRHKLQKGLLTRDQEPKEEEMKMMSDYITKLESFPDLEVSIIRSTKINKVLKAILKLDSIPKEEEFNFNRRSQTLLDKWTKILAGGDAAAAPAASVTPAPTNGVNGTKAEEKKDTPAVSEGVKEASKDAEKLEELDKAADKEEKDKKPEQPELPEKADEEPKKVSTCSAGTGRSQGLGPLFTSQKF
ncbi:PWWP domain-containing protein2, partial [Colletotrichum shisoi]